MLVKTLERMAWIAWLLIALSAAGLVWMMSDVSPPFAMVSATTNKPKPGELLRVDAVVQRQLKRQCGVTFSRHMFDSSGTRMELAGDTYMPPEALEQLEGIAPGRLRLAVPVPPHAQPGPAKLVTPLSYQCNAWHSLRPIHVLMTIDFEVAG